MTSRCNVMRIPSGYACATTNYKAQATTDPWLGLTSTEQTAHAAVLLPSSATAPHPSLLFISDLPTLAVRRKYFSLCSMFKIVNQLMHFPQDVFVPGTTPFLHSSKHFYCQPFCRTNSYLNSFVPKTCSDWNSLPLSVRSSDSISSFKSSLRDRMNA